MIELDDDLGELGLCRPESADRANRVADCPDLLAPQRMRHSRLGEQRATAADLSNALEAFIKAAPDLATPMQLGAWVRSRFPRDNTGPQTSIPVPFGPGTQVSPGTQMSPGTSVGPSTRSEIIGHDTPPAVAALQRARTC